MKKLPLLLALYTSFFAGETIHSGAKVYVTPTNDDFDRYLMGEIQKEGLPIVLVTKREEAEFEIAVTSSSHRTEGSSPSMFSIGDTNGDEIISIINLKTRGIIFSETVHDRKARGYKSTAEICAKHLRKYIKKH